MYVRGLKMLSVQLRFAFLHDIISTLHALGPEVPITSPLICPGRPSNLGCSDPSTHIRNMERAV
jgi:hypothetical protein